MENKYTKIDSEQIYVVYQTLFDHSRSKLLMEKYAKYPGSGIEDLDAGTLNRMRNSEKLLYRDDISPKLNTHLRSRTKKQTVLSEQRQALKF